jgi:hypothetical protein
VINTNLRHAGPLANLLEGESIRHLSTDGLYLKACCYVIGLWFANSTERTLGSQPSAIQIEPEARVASIPLTQILGTTRLWATATGSRKAMCGVATRPEAEKKRQPQATRSSGKPVWSGHASGDAFNQRFLPPEIEGGWFHPELAMRSTWPRFERWGARGRRRRAAVA